jgi:hypothetical protein
MMAPMKRKQTAAVPVIPLIDPNNQLPFASNHVSVVSEAGLLHLVEIGVLPPKELCSWRIWRGFIVLTEDTHEAVIFMSFLIRGLALPVYPFFHGLLDFYSMNLTHLNPNYVLQIAVFVHLCEAFLGIFPHFGFGSTSTIIGPGWLEGSISLLVVLAWNFAKAGKPSLSTFP